MPTDKDVSNIEWNSLVKLGLPAIIPEFGETYNNVIKAPSIVSMSPELGVSSDQCWETDIPTKHIPAVNTRGNSINNQKDVPFVASTLAIPNRATSVLVSNPNPKRNPKGYIFHGLSMNVNTLLNMRVIFPPMDLRTSSFVVRCSTGRRFCARRKRYALTWDIRTKIFANPIMKRNLISLDWGD